MEQLKFFTKTIDSNLLNAITGLSGKLITMTKSGKYKTEKELSMAIAKEKGHQYYLNLKQRTLRLLHGLFLVSPPINKKEAAKDKWDVRRKYITAVSLIEIGKRDLAWKPLLQAYRISTEIGYSEIAYSCAAQLMTSCALNKRPADFEKYRELVDVHLKDMQSELEIRKIYFEYAQHVIESKSVNYSLFIRQIDKLTKLNCKTPYFIQHYYTLRIYLDMNEGNFSLVKRTSEAAIREMKSQRGVTGSILEQFHKTKAIAEIALKDHKAAAQTLKKAEDYSVEKSYNWHILQYYKAINYLHGKNYKKAHELYRKFRKNKYEAVAEQWLIMGGYLYFLREIGIISAPFERFKVGRFLNDTTSSAGDKKGSNVNVLIGELLILLVTNRSKFIERVDAINHYSYRYLKEEQTKRAMWFIRLLCKLPNADFDPKKLLKKGNDYINKLKSHPVGMGDNLSLEVIPYDHIVEFLKEGALLEKKLN